MYKSILLAIVLFAAYASAEPTKLRGVSSEFGRVSDFDLEEDGAAAPGSTKFAVPIANRLAELQKHYSVHTKLPQKAVVEHESSHLQQETTSNDEHTSSGKNHNNRIRSKNKNKVTNVSQKEKFNNDEEEVKQTPTLFHSKKSQTNYSKSYNKSKKKNVADYDQDEESHSKFVHKKNNSSNKLRKNHVKDSNGKHINEKENFANNEEEVYAKSS